MKQTVKADYLISMNRIKPCRAYPVTTRTSLWKTGMFHSSASCAVLIFTCSHKYIRKHAHGSLWFSTTEPPPLSITRRWDCDYFSVSGFHCLTSGMDACMKCKHNDIDNMLLKTQKS